MKAASTIVYSLYRGTPMHYEWIVACLGGAWNSVLGDRIADSCRPITLRGTELFVEVIDKDWLPVLTEMKDELLGRIRSATGGAVQQLTLKLPGNA